MHFTIAFETRVDRADPAEFQGRSLVANRHSLDAIAHEYDLRGIGEFVAFSQSEAEALAEDMKFDAPTTGSQTGRWFPSEQAIEVVRAIRRHLAEDPDELGDTELEPVRAELDDLERLLEIAHSQQVRFRLSIAY